MSKLEYKSKFDYILTLYNNGGLEEIINQKGLKNAKIYYQIGKKGNYLQVEFTYCNLIVNIEFSDLKYNYIIYKQNISPFEFEKRIQEFSYSNEFNTYHFLNKLLDDLLIQINHDMEIRGLPR